MATSNRKICGNCLSRAMRSSAAGMWITNHIKTYWLIELACAFTRKIVDAVLCICGQPGTMILSRRTQSQCSEMEPQPIGKNAPYKSIVCWNPQTRQVGVIHRHQLDLVAVVSPATTLNEPFECRNEGQIRIFWSDCNVFRTSRSPSPWLSVPSGLGRTV